MTNEERTDFVFDPLQGTLETTKASTKAEPEVLTSVTLDKEGQKSPQLESKARNVGANATIAKLLNTRRNRIIIATAAFLACGVIIAVAITVAHPPSAQNYTEKKENISADTATAQKSKQTSMNLTSTQNYESTIYYTTISTEMRTTNGEIRSYLAKSWYGIHYSGHVYMYKLSSQKSDYSAAKNECMEQGAKLASIGLKTKGVRDKLFAGMVFPYGQTIYIGLDDLSSKHTWKWLDGIYSTRHNTMWASSEPQGTDERCGTLRSNKNLLIKAEPCNERFHYLCEKII